MKDTSKVIMGATLIMVVSLAIVLGIVLVLLVELYCSVLLRRRQLRITSPRTRTTTAAPATSPCEPSQTPDQLKTPLSRFYAPGVLHAPRCILFPVVSCKENKVDTKNPHIQLHQILEGHTAETNASPHRIGIPSPSPPSTSSVPSTRPVKEISVEVGTSSACEDYPCGGGEHFVYISNPIYDSDPSRADTPFETPDTSPSRLETCGGSSGDEETAQPSPSLVMTPPLTPMKRLPAEACSISLKHARSLGSSGSDTMTNNGLSSSSSGSPCTSPSW
ncbi:hypothetical protein CFOL_v3_25590 [Cephalotus follicularis]|uniref:Uncharacterized protein n=1 Tax=Cephalotus follicularis TaxID=3775 RepID=A0A1Q3CPI3_CEPFO|nr:hypothetical protein CFOL_v3_25590 [Cephalotus follicularis]